MSWPAAWYVDAVHSHTLPMRSYNPTGAVGHQLEKQGTLSSPPNAPGTMGEESSSATLSGTVYERRSYRSCSVGGKRSLVTVHENHLQLCHPWGTFPDKDNKSQRVICLCYGRCSSLSRGKPGSLHLAASWGRTVTSGFLPWCFEKRTCFCPFRSSIHARDGVTGTHSPPLPFLTLPKHNLSN